MIQYYYYYHAPFCSHVYYQLMSALCGLVSNVLLRTGARVDWRSSRSKKLYTVHKQKHVRSDTEIIIQLPTYIILWMSISNNSISNHYINTIFTMFTKWHLNAPRTTYTELTHIVSIVGNKNRKPKMHSLIYFAIIYV